jgi:FkbM family methyltransferase
MNVPGKGWLRRYLARRLYVPEIPAALYRLKAQGFSPNRIFDVGAYRGDFARECMALWPKAEVFCFEPQGHMQEALGQLHAEQPLVQVYPVLLGARDAAQVTLYCAETASSVLKEYHVQHPSMTCAQTTVDQVVGEEPKRRAPDLLKLDVQGYELEVLKGAEKSLPSIGAILLEINLIDIYHGVPLLAEVVAWLNERDFVAFDIGGLMRRPLDRALFQMDMIFVHRESPLRADKRWAATN